MREIVRLMFGSRLYGTSTPASDLDYKTVFIPAARDILLQRVPRSISTQRPKADGEKNFAGEEDTEAYSLQQFLKLAAEGQTVALDMLFAPDWALIGETAPEWRQIIKNRKRLLTGKSASFVGYARRQASKYGIKGSRVAASRAALAMLEEGVKKYGTIAKLEFMRDQIAAAVIAHDHMELTPITGVSGVTIDHWDVCGRKMPFTSSIKNAHGIMERLVAEYGQRALQAEQNEGVDWKALSHAVRVGTQAIELLRTGNVTFPLENAPHHVDIKLGKLPYKAVAEEIEELLVAVEAEAERSTLPAEPDHEWIDDFVADIYGWEVGRFMWPAVCLA